MNETAENVQETTSAAERREQLVKATREQLPKYRSHKEVRAVKIARLSFGYSELYDRAVHLLHPEDESLQPIAVTQEFLSKHNPVAPGYFVRYTDNYESWSPVEAFESGYTQIQDAQPEQARLLAEGLAYREPIDNGDRHA